MEIRSGSVLFEALRGGGPRTATSTVAFSRGVQRAVAGLTGYTAGFRGGDHHVGELDVGLDTEIDGSNANVTVRLGVRDWSGSWDDDYAGVVQFVVLAELDPIGPPGGIRQDLRITGAEMTQATQHFRSPHLGADNSIRLIARKSLAVRVYVDFDALAGGTPILALGGELLVTTSIGSTTLTLSPIRSISPRRDSQIDRSQIDHTLNFLIPEAWCQGELTVRCQVFDQAIPGQRSPALQRTIRFADVAPLRVYGVGVHYTGQGLDLPPPAQTDVLSTLNFAETTYPVGEVELTGYLVHDFSTDMKADIDDGCGDGFNGLLDDLRDMRGGATDVYYAVLPAGIDSGDVGGCGGGGVGAGFIGGGATAAQEIGHAFGRDHAPCDDESRCQNPAHQDPNYPDYSPFPSDSIGEFGYDTRTHTVKPPAANFDFMGYSGPDWVSPYTYEGLMSRFPSSSGASGSSALSWHRAMFEDSSLKSDNSRAEWIRREMPTLYLWLEIERDRRVQRLPSFHYPVTIRTRGRTRTGFTVEIRDSEGRVLTCQQLLRECRHCPDGCWPQHIRQQIPFPSNGRELVIREGDEVIYTEMIGDPPALTVGGKYDKRRDEIRLEWNCTANRRGKQATKKARPSDRDECWYLPQYRDDRGVWRGLSPRTQRTKMWVPAALAARRDSLELRVLATTGIATAVEYVDVAVPVPEEPPTTTIVTLAPEGAGDRPMGHRALTVGVLDELGRTIPDQEILWYDESRNEIGRGRSLDLGDFPEGQHIVYPAVLGTADMGTLQGLLIERDDQGLVTVRPGLTPEEERARDTHTHPSGQLTGRD